MPKKLIARTAKLLTESKRGHRGKGVAVTYEHIPRDVDERNHGSIYAVINVNAPTGEAEEITELITDAFHGEYYQDLSRDPLTSFETALSKVNEELGEATHAGNTSWLKNLNAILAVLSGTTLHITKAGSAEAYLYRAINPATLVMTWPGIPLTLYVPSSILPAATCWREIKLPSHPQASFFIFPKMSCKNMSKNFNLESLLAI
jgi:hypothetical protein